MCKAVPKPAPPGTYDHLTLLDWGAFTGPVVPPERVQPLIDAGTSRWICVDFVTVGPDAPYNTAELEVAINASDCIIITRNLDAIDTAVGRIAKAGSKVLVFERPDGVPLPAPLVKALM